MLAGLGLVLLVPSEAGSARRWTGRGLALLAALIGLLSLSENLFGWRLGIDQLLAKEPPGTIGVAAPNLMGTPAASSFLLIGLAILLLSRRDGRGTRAAQGLALAVSLIDGVSASPFSASMKCIVFPATRLKSLRPVMPCPIRN